MKRFLFGLLAVLVIATGVITLLNVKTTTRQGINYEWHTIQIPLYLKILDFYDRNFNYKQLVKRIIEDEHDEKEKVMKIFSWTYHNIRKQPKELPVIDDHVWHIIVRGYGVIDQSSDVFATLCNYAGMDAFYNYVSAQNEQSKIVLSFVKIKNDWYIFDPYHGVYFKDGKGDLADIEVAKSGNFTVENIGEKSNINYYDYLKNLAPITGVSLSRVNTQSPMNRLKYEIKKTLRRL